MMIKLLVASLATASAFKVANQPTVKPAPLLKLRGGGVTDLDTASLLGAIYYGSFGVTLLANPSMFYGKDGFLPYMKAEMGPVGTFFGRAFGAMMTGLAAIHFTDGPNAAILKAMAIAGICMLPQMYANFADKDNFVELMWGLQLPTHVVVSYILGKAGGLF